jgi:three-Cys-motif partner protein
MVRRRPEVEGQEALFPTADLVAPERRTFKQLTRPLWTESKAALIARYLYYFVLVTKHGTYIDAFAGRQSDRAEEGWAVEQVMKNKPERLRKYFLFEKSGDKAAELEGLKAVYPGRIINVKCGDCNDELPRQLPVGALREKEASFCLLDQRTFECHWATCSHVASIKPMGYKVEQFYFLAQGWLDRSLAAISTAQGAETAEKWWGRPDWGTLRDLHCTERAELVAQRFRSEFGYKEACAWPIFDRGGGTRIMYYMVHATDHPAAPPLMRRAYEWAVAPVEEDEAQLELEFEGFSLARDE